MVRLHMGGFIGIIKGGLLVEYIQVHNLGKIDTGLNNVGFEFLIVVGS